MFDPIHKFKNIGLDVEKLLILFMQSRLCFTMFINC